MEFVGQPRPSGACNLLEVPGLSSLDVDDDEGEVVIGIRPKSSPLPRRRSSVTDEDSEPEPPLSGSRRVSFADAKGLSLVQVKEFDTWDALKLLGYDSSEGEGKEETEEYFLSPLTFSLPLPTEELSVKVRDQKVELETIELLPGTTILKGVIRVLNISFSKAVYIRTTLDTWSSHFDLLAEYIPGSSDGLMDCFSFKLTLVPPFGEQGARVDFCLRYETPMGTFWANNNDRNYVLFCHQRMKEKPQKELVHKKSCLKTVSQNFPSVENISAMEDSSQENNSAVVSKNAEEVNAMKAKQISDGQTEEDVHKLQAENRRNSSRRSRRKAARAARVRDYFAQRDRGVNNGDESPPEAKQEAQEENPEEKHPDVRSLSEGGRKSELSRAVSEPVATCSESLLDVSPDTPAARDNASNGEPEKSESDDLAESGGGSAADVPDNLLHSNGEPAPAEGQNINKCDGKAQGKSQKQGTSYECTDNTAAEPADSVASAEISEGLVNQTNCFTFGTVVAPLYHQMFGKVGSESQSVGDWGNPVRATVNIGNVTHTERKESSVPTDVRNDKVQGNVIKTQESKQECVDATANSPPTEEEGTSLRATANDILDRTETLQDPGEVIKSDQRITNASEAPKTTPVHTEAHPHAVNVLHTDTQTPTQGSHLRGDAQDDNPTRDLQNQTTAETAGAQPPEQTCSQVKNNPDKAVSQTEAPEVAADPETSLRPSHVASERVADETDQQTGGSGGNGCKCVDESGGEDGTGKTVTIPTASASSEEDNLLETLHDLSPKQANHSATEETANSYISCCEILDFSTLETSQGETNNVEERNKLTNSSYGHETKHSAEIEVSSEEAESLTKAMTRNCHVHSDVFVESKDEDTLKDEAVIASEKIGHREMEAAVSKREDFSLADAAGVKNWEMMVEEEEKNILTDQGGSGETALENRDASEEEKEEAQEELAVELTAAGENGTKAENAVGLEVRQGVREEEIWGIVAGQVREDAEEESEHVQIAQTAGEEEVAEESEVEKREEQEETESEKEKYFAEMQEVGIERTRVGEEEEREREGGMEIDSNDGDEAGVAWGDRVKPRQENVEEENPNYKEEILVVEAGESEIVDANSEGIMENGEYERGCFEERLDITQNRVEDGLSAPVSSVQDERVTGKENTRKGENALVPAEMRPTKGEDFQSSERVTHDRPKAENGSPAGEGDALADEPESDQASHGSASAESDSDDEVELYMHCLRAVHAGPRAAEDRNRDAGFSAGKRPSTGRSKLLSSPMPSISESLDEDQHLGCLHDDREDADAADIQPTAAAALSPSSGQEGISRNVSWWKETFSCSNISKTLLYATLLMIFIVVAYHYDFLACFGLYLISVVWLYCQGERQPVKSNSRIG